MSNVLTFTPRPKLVSLPAPEPVSDLTLRAQLEEAAEVAVDTAQRLIALLDRIDGDADLEDGADAEPSLAAPENHHGAQVVWMRGNGHDREAEAPEIVLPEVAVTPVPKLRPAALVPTALAWGGSGNVVAAAGVLLLGFAGVR